MLSRSCMPFTPSLMSLSFHAAKSVSLLRASSCFAFVGILIICGRDVKQGHTALGHICLIGRVQAHHPHLHWLHLQRGLQHFQLTLFVSGPISHLHWLRIWLGTHLGTHCHCQTQNPIPMNSMSSNDSLLICAQMLNSHQKRRSWTASTVEKGTWHICAWKESIQQRRTGGKTTQWECFSIS